MLLQSFRKSQGLGGSLMFAVLGSFEAMHSKRTKSLLSLPVGNLSWQPDN